MTSNKTAVIIGAGPAGLTAAFKFLKETDIIPIVLEEADVVGGISRTVSFNGNRMDLGGHRFFSKNTEIMNLWKELMPIQGKSSKDDLLLNNNDKVLSKSGPDPQNEDCVMLIRRRISRIFYLRNFFDYPISLRFQTFKNMGLFRSINCGFGYIFSMLHQRTERTLQDFYINRFGKPLYTMFFEDYTEKLWGVHPSRITPEWGAQRVKGLSLSKAVLDVITRPFYKKDISQNKVETSLIEQFIYPKRGPGQLWELLADEIVKLGGKIILNAKVVEIKTCGGTVEAVHFEDGNGKICTMNGDYFISSMPVKDLVAGIGDIVPAEIKNIAAQLPYRDFITVGLLLNKLNIKNTTNIKTVSDIIPDCWIYIQERDVKIGRLQIFNNWSPYMVNDFENTVWIGLEYFCNEGDSMWCASDEEFINFAIDELCKIDIIDKNDVLDSIRIKVKKAYPAYFGSYHQFGKLRAYLDGFDNMYCVGRNGQHRYNNMDHSMLTAIEAVRAISKGEKSKERIWNVNTEGDYHETKST